MGTIEGAFAEHAPRLIRTLTIAGGDQHHAIVGVREAFVRLSGHWDRLDGDPYDHIVRAAVGWWRDHPAPLLPDPAMPLGPVTDSQQVAARARAAIAELLPVQRLAVALFASEQMSASQVARAMSLTDTAVAFHLDRCRHKLAVAVDDDRELRRLVLSSASGSVDLDHELIELTTQIDRGSKVRWLRRAVLVAAVVGVLAAAGAAMARSGERAATPRSPGPSGVREQPAALPTRPGETLAPVVTEAPAPPGDITELITEVVLAEVTEPTPPPPPPETAQIPVVEEVTSTTRRSRGTTTTRPPPAAPTPPTTAPTTIGPVPTLATTTTEPTTSTRASTTTTRRPTTTTEAPPIFLPPDPTTTTTDPPTTTTEATTTTTEPTTTTTEPTPTT